MPGWSGPYPLMPLMPPPLKGDGESPGLEQMWTCSDTEQPSKRPACLSPSSLAVTGKVGRSRT